MNGMAHHESHRMGTDVWLTPQSILQPLGPFDLDPCAAPEPRPWPTAEKHITLPADGLNEDWHGRIWLNPPYGRAVWRWMEHLADHGRGTAIIFARTETLGFQRFVWGRASALLFLPQRVRFRLPDGSLPDATRGGGQAGAPSVIVAYGDDDATILENCSLSGVFTRNWTTR